MILLKDGKRFEEFRYKLEDDFEKDIVDSYERFFGERSIYIDAKKKIKSQFLGNIIPDGFLFDLSDPNDPSFYIVEIELATHSFFEHIFPQVTKFFAFYKNNESRHELINYLHDYVIINPKIDKAFKELIGDKEIYKYISDLVNSSQNILIVIDKEKPEFAEIIETYSDPWGEIVKIMIVKKFVYGDEYIYYADPEFENIEYSVLPNEEGTTKKSYDEPYHLNNVDSNNKASYEELKRTVKKMNHSLIFNPQKSYISIKSTRNLVYIYINKKKIVLVVLLPEEKIREKLKYHEVKTLTENVQSSYGSTCAAVVIEKSEHMDEIAQLIEAVAEQFPPKGNA